MLCKGAARITTLAAAHTAGARAAADGIAAHRQRAGDDATAFIPNEDQSQIGYFTLPEASLERSVAVMDESAPWWRRNRR